MSIPYSKISVDLFDVVNIYKLVVCQRVNQHVFFYLDADVTHDSKDSDIFTQNYFDRPIQLMFDGSVVMTFLIQKITFKRLNGLIRIKVTAASASILMDRALRDRSFQNINVSYQDIFNLVGTPYGFSNVLAESSAQGQIGAIKIQYQESDWQFFQRMASQLGLFLFPIAQSSKPQIYVGKSYSHSLEWNDVFSSFSYNLADRGLLSVDIPHMAQLGQELLWQGSRYYLKRSTLQLKNAELIHLCDLVTQDGLVCDYQYNQPLIGVALRGVVTKVRDTRVKIKLDIDQNQMVPANNEKWFDYMSVYSSPRGNGWYFMPEVGDAIYLRVPGRDEGEGYAEGAVHVTDTKRENPEIKFIRTRDGKVIRFTPDSIEIMVTEDTYIKLHDSGNIAIVAEGNIDISAGNDISILAERNVSIAGGSFVSLKRKSSELFIADSIKGQAKNVRLL